MTPHLYLICNRLEALVASHLTAEDFGTYMAVGTRKNNYGNVMFFEIDPAVRHAYPAADAALRQCTPRPDGQPRRSKYASIYRVMENLPRSAFNRLYLGTRDGRVLGLDPTEPASEPLESSPYLYQELAPVAPLVTSSLAPAAFADHITNPANLVHVPRIFFADLRVDRDPDGHLAGSLPYPHPPHIEDCLRDMAEQPGKKIKTVNRNPEMRAFYRTIRHGFYLGDQDGLTAYPFPTSETLDALHHPWWRSASME
ncbi:MAG TPA: hypothetical protein PKE55_04745 [Kiritimatiellia bacterium]|nr:hypothetical protein [Kiritimatiellia bacterium]